MKTKSIMDGKKIDWDFFVEEFCRKKHLQCNPYFEAVEKYGEPGYDECFGYGPLLSLGGKESVTHLKKVKYEVFLLHLWVKYREFYLICKG